MSDSVTVDNAALTDYTVASDDDGVAQHQYVKLEWGPDNTQTKVNTGAAAVPIQDGGNSLTVDGTVTITDGGSSISVDDNGSTISVDDGAGSLTIDGAVTISDGGNVISVDDAGSTLSVDDGGGSLTVDGTVAVSSISGTTTFPGATNIASGQTAPTSSAASIVSSRAARVELILANHGSVDVYVGPATVTTANGFKMLPGTSLSLRTSAAIQGITAAGTGAIHYMEVY